ncbi:MAG: hypothetical protein ACRD5W_17825 [Candidatus Acidiferrales bacterium]
MSFVLGTVSYVAAFVVIMLVDWFGVMAGFLIPLLPARKHSSIPFRFLVDGFSAFLSIYLVGFLDEMTPLRASIAMVVLPAGLILLNDYERLWQVHSGESRVRMLLELRGEGHLYDKRHDVLMKGAERYGHLAGFATGLVTFLGDVPFW